MFCPDWTPDTLAWLGNWGNIMYILPAYGVLMYFEKYGRYIWQSKRETN